ncbi:hypothetical protein [Sphingomonas sp. Leaf62]|uniref:hypothetical protein n=1 Tax=Sphingomonas sp. Leaf62 TaxID=1736228 RepID=UPI0006FF8AA5|nr:hypothetical protein [Sphingomonas sp. Leaf62]KQN77875.1 hypothetical protein ASE91_14250 [Sphingomonas sp. Leaf62]
MAQLPGQIVRSLLPGAARAGAKVVADEAKSQSRSPDVAAALTVKTRRGEGHVTAFVGVDPKAQNGWAYSLARWQEWGTEPHFITVDDSQREGMTASRINYLAREQGTLVINGKPVGRTVHHPGADPHPIFRPAMDLKEVEAKAAAQAYINARVSRAGIAPDPGDSDP